MTSDRELFGGLQRGVLPRELGRTAEWLAGLDPRPGSELQAAYEELAVRCQAAGASEVQLRSYAFGPAKRYFSWTDDRRPQVTEAEVWLEEDDGEQLLCRFSEEPDCLIGALRSTAPEGERFELVDVGAGTQAADYRSRRMGGRVALAWGASTSAALLEALGERQAAGALVGPDDPRAPGDGRVVPVFGPPGWYGGGRPFAFRLTAAQRERAMARLAAGAPISVRVQIQASLGEGELPVVCASLRGSDRAEECVTLVAETADPYAVAASLEAFRALAAAVVDGTCRPPRRSLQLLLLPDQRSQVAWLADPARESEHGRGALLVESDQRRAPLPAGAALSLEEPSPSCRPSFVNDAVNDRFAACLGPRAMVTRSYHWGSPTSLWNDGLVGVPASRVRLSTAALAAGPRPLVAALAGAALELTSLERHHLPRLISNAQLAGAARIAAVARRLQRRARLALDGEGGGEGRARRHLLWLTAAAIERALGREVGALYSVVTYLDGPGDETVRLAMAAKDLEQAADAAKRSLQAEIAAGATQRARLAARRRPLSALERRADAVVAERLVEGPPPLARVAVEVPAEDRRWLADNQLALAAQPLGEVLLSAIDGERSVRAIYDALVLEHEGVDLRLVWRYLEVLEAAGLVRLAEVEPS